MSIPPTPAGTGGATCPSCGAGVVGQFCASCGASLAGAACASCGVALSLGARFCHRCGRPAGAAAATAPRSAAGGVLPWAIALIALLSLVALVAGQRMARADGAPTRSADGRAAVQTPGAATRAPDISGMSPGERADRLYARLMTLDANGRRDSVRLFAPMALAAFRMLGPLTTEQRYDFGRVAELVGDAETAAAQADTILAANPRHLLGLMLAASAAEVAGDAQGRRTFERRLLAAAPAERDRTVAEYLRHGSEIDRALDAARPR